MFTLVNDSKTPLPFPKQCVLKECVSGFTGSLTACYCKVCKVTVSTTVQCTHACIFQCGHGFCNGCGQGVKDPTKRLFTYKEHKKVCIYRQRLFRDEIMRAVGSTATIMMHMGLGQITDTADHASFGVGFSLTDLSVAKNLFDKITLCDEHKVRCIKPLTKDMPLCAHCGCGLSFWLIPEEWVNLNAVLCPPCFSRSTLGRDDASLWKLYCSAATDSKAITKLLGSAQHELHQHNRKECKILVPVPSPASNRLANLQLPPITRQDFDILAAHVCNISIQNFKDDDHPQDITIVGHIMPKLSYFRSETARSQKCTIIVDGSEWQDNLTITDGEPRFAVKTTGSSDRLESTLVYADKIPNPILEQYISSLKCKSMKSDKKALTTWLGRPGRLQYPASDDCNADVHRGYLECNIDQLQNAQYGNNAANLITKHILQPLEELRAMHPSMCSHFDSTTVLLIDVNERSERCGTMLHVDPAHAVNMLISFDPDQKTQVHSLNDMLCVYCA